MLVGAAIAVLSTALAVALVLAAHEQRIDGLHDRGAFLVEIHAQALAGPVRDHDLGQADAILAALEADADLVTARLIDRDGTVLAQVGTGPGAGDLSFAADVRDISGGSSLGAIEIELSTDRIDQAFAESIVIAGSSIVVATVAVIIVVLAVLSYLVGPMETMTAALRRLAEGDVEIDVPATHRTDEVGDLARAIRVFRDNNREIADLRLDKVRAYAAAEEQQRLRALTEMLHRRNRELARAKQESEAANDAKTRFLANMSHELRTPLNAIIGFSDVIRGEVLGNIGDRRYVEYADDINRSGGHLLSLIDDLLDLSRIELDKFELRREAVNVIDEISRAIGMVQRDALAGGVQIAIRPMAPSVTMDADARAVRQILINLLSNAIKFTPRDGTVTVSVDHGPGDLMAITVEDTGIGIAEDDIDRVLKPFERAKSDFAQPAPGTGLGLPLSKSLAEAHGGALEIESRLGHGTRVTVTFPRQNEAAAAAG